MNTIEVVTILSQLLGIISMIVTVSFFFGKISSEIKIAVHKIDCVDGKVNVLQEKVERNSKDIAVNFNDICMLKEKMLPKDRCN